jgi:hypothetical protein
MPWHGLARGVSVPSVTKLPSRLLLALSLVALVAVALPALAGSSRGVTVHRVDVPKPGGQTLRPEGLVARGAEARASTTRMVFGASWLEVKTEEKDVVIRAGRLDKQELEVKLPRSGEDGGRPPGHLIGPARVCADELFIAVEVDLLPKLRSEKHRTQTHLVVLALKRGDARGKAQEVGKVTGGSSWGSSAEGWVLGTEVVIDESCNLWAIESVRSWGLKDWEPEEAAKWELTSGSEQLCVNEGSPERTTLRRMSLATAIRREMPDEIPEDSEPLLMVSGADYSPARDPLPKRLRARCAWAPAGAADEAEEPAAE